MSSSCSAASKSSESPCSDSDGSAFVSPLHHTGSGRIRRGSTIHPPTAPAEWFKWLPPLFSSCPDPSVPNQRLCIAAVVCPDRNGICLSAVDFNGGCYSVTHNHVELERIKPLHMTVSVFCSAMAKQFVDQTFRVYRSGAKVMLILKDDVCFSLRHNDDSSSVVWAMVSNVLRAVTLRTSGDPSEAVSALNVDLDQLQIETRQLEEERVKLRLAVAQHEEEEREHLQQYTILQNELIAATEYYHQICDNRGIDPKDFEGPVEPQADSRCSYGRPPLDTDCRSYDINLMMLIKGRLCRPPNSHDESSPRDGCDTCCCSVVRLISPSEYSTRMELLPMGKTAKVLECLQKLDCWDFDVWTMQDMTAQGSMFYTAYALFLKWDLFRRLGIDEQVAINFFSQVEAGYHPNPYHNSVHGADVMHILHYALHQGKGKEVLGLQDHDVLAMLLAGMIHDFDHPGLNNNFHVKVQSYLATLYNDRSMLENHHLAEVFDLIKTPKFNILHSLTPQHYTDVRDTMVEVVLYTDMQLHAKILGNWKRRLTQDHNLSQKKEDQRLALSMCIKMADISNCCRPLDIYLKWSTVLVEEFFLQGDNEKARGDPISPFMDRQQPFMGKSQVAFMNYVIIPMFESVAECLPEMSFTVEIAAGNSAYWKDQKEIRMESGR
eukprot:GGOE01002536.1.p1 GENE.GGOE01002536.1~~GGOE01002536.1.p1  ORF type:complete len:662 (-),score=189.21 GGOE01002536.1:361-2346(-)